MKVESLVIANHYVAVNLYPGLVHTARHTLEIYLARKKVIHPIHLLIVLYY